MSGRLIQTLLALAASMLASQRVSSAIPAFSGAEGYGKHTVGGRGGIVYEVTNLDDSGPGSLRAAVEASGPRTVVFRISGTIILESDLKINNPYITIAGQTAPGDGICLRKHSLVINADDVIIRYLRVRFGNESGRDADAVSSRYTENIIVDHVSASWSVDEVMSIYHCDNITVQWCLVSESLYDSNHIKGAHGFGGIWGANNSTYHHNLLAHHSSRNPRFASGCGNTDYRNNVVYNWGYNSSYGGEKVQSGNPELVFANINMVANYYRPGPATRPDGISSRIVNPSSRDGAADYGKWHVSQNTLAGNAAVTADNWNGGVQPQGGNTFLAGIKLEEPWPAMPIAEQSAEDAFASVLESAGAILPRRDSIDTRIIDETRGGYATYEGTTYEQNNNVPDPSEKCGIIDTQGDVGGWPELASAEAPVDTDRDGMPDYWEIERALDPDDPTDRNADFDNDGFTNLEEYLNQLGAFKAVQDIAWVGQNSNRYAQIENWSIDFQPSHLDTALIDNATVVVDAIDQHAGTLKLSNNASLTISTGSLEVLKSLEIDSSSEFWIQSDGTLHSTGNIVNEGTLRLSGNAQFEESSALTNNGILDLIAWNGTLPDNFTNNGTVLDQTSLQLASLKKTPNGISFQVQGYRGHSYQLQTKTDLASDQWQNLGDMLPGEGTPIPFQIDLNAERRSRFFRVVLH